MGLNPGKKNPALQRENGINGKEFRSGQTPRPQRPPKNLRAHVHPDPLSCGF
jgi:hypothetical protein